MKKKSLLLILLMALLAPWAAKAQETLTVCSGSATNTYIPVNGLYVDTKGACSEFVIPATTEGLDAVAGGTITKLTFYLSSIPDTWGSPTIQLYVGEVENTTLTTLGGPSAYTVVSTSVWSNQSSTLEVTFDTPYTYMGGNLLIGTYVSIKSSSYKTTTFVGVSAPSGSARYRTSSSGAGTAVAFLPKTTITYTPTEFPMPKNLAYENVDPSATNITWQAPETANTITGYKYQYKKASEAEWSSETTVNTTSCSLTSLDGATAYNFKVKTVYGGDESLYAKINFTTIDPCSAPTNFVAESENITENSADISWTPGYNETAWLVKYKKSSEEWTSASEENVNAPNVILSGLAINTTYNVRISPDCDDTKYLSGSFTTKNPCATPTALLITNILADEVTLSWTPGYMETEWTVKYKKSSETWENALEENASGSPTITLSGLDKDTDYNVRIYNCETYLSGDFCTADDCPDGKVCIGTGHSTNTNIPANNFYNYSLSEQIYTAAEIGEAGYILSIDFFKANTTAMVKDLDIYIVTTTKNEFASNTDWIQVSANDLVYSGTVTFTNNAWTTIELDTPFNYDGLSNIAIVVDNNTNGYVSSTGFYAFSANNNQALYYQSDDTNLNPTTEITTSGTIMKNKNRIRLTIGEPPSCAKPIGLEVNYTGGTTATVSWTSEASAWNIDVNGTVTAITENPYTLTGLELNTEYEVKVQANCDGPTSDWSSSVSFTTDLCMPADMCELTFELTDSYGDGWNGNAIKVFDKLTGRLLATMANENLDDLTQVAETQIVTLAVCDGREIEFQWVKGSYPGEASWVIKDVNGDEITSGTGTTSMNTGDVLATYTVDCTVTTCKKPTNLAKSEVSGHSAKLSWTENGEATEWVVAYKTGSSDFTETDANTNPFTLTGLDPETEYTVKVRPICDVDNKWSDEITFTTDVACPTPKIGTITTTPFTATVNWTGFSDSYNLRYVANPNYCFQGFVTDPGAMSNGADASWTHNGSSTWGPGVQYASGNKLADDFTVYSATKLTEIEVYGYQTGSTTTSTFTALYVEIYDGNPMSGGNVIWGDMTTNIMTSTSFTNCYRGSENDATGMTRPVMAITASGLDIDLTAGTYWLAFSLDGSGSSGPWGVPYSDPINGNIGDGIQYTSGAWQNLNDSGTGAYGPAMKLTFGDGNIENYEWNYVNNIAENNYTLTSLDPETFHLVQVKGNCGGDGNSLWSDIASFTTPSNCTPPTALVAEPLDESATLSWAGYQDKFNVRYRTAGYYDPIWEDNFENGLNQWTIIAGENAEAVGANDVWYTTNPTGGLGFPAYSGDYCASSWSWSTNAYYANNWLITPQLNLQGVAKYYVRTNAGFPDKYEVLLSTTTAADTLNFNVTLKAMATAPAVADWTEVIIDLKDYEGQQGYIAIHHLDYNANYLLIDDFGIYTVTPAGAWTTLNNQDNPVVITTEAGTAYEWQVQGVYAGCDDGVTEWSEMASFTTYNQVYDDEEWGNGETTIDDDVLLIQDVIIPNGVVAYANSITLEPGAHLIIEDGGQLYTNEPVVATVQKSMSHTAKDSENWYTISSPVNNIAPAAVTNLIQGSTDDYDLYLYNEPTTMWLNQKKAENAAMFANLTNGRGYLYWNSTGAELAFTGTLNVDDVNIALTKTGSDALAGFNLIGNPFSHNIYKGTGGAIENTKLAAGYYTLKNGSAETWKTQLDYNTPIKPGQGILVQATESFNLTIANSTSPATGEKRSNDDNIMFVINNSQFEDIAYALFNDGIGLEKINHRNPDAPMLFIPQDGENYAIATMGDDTETFGLNFKAMTTGMYTLSAKADGNYSYLHVIDRLTGEDIDMLVDGKYEFIGSPRDNEARFIVKLRYNANGFDNDEFIYQNGDELIVNGEGELQVYDVMGRYVACYNVNGNKRISAEQFSNAVYIFRLVGSDVKTQKIVVR